MNCVFGPSRDASLAWPRWMVPHVWWLLFWTRILERYVTNMIRRNPCFPFNTIQYKNRAWRGDDVEGNGRMRQNACVNVLSTPAYFNVCVPVLNHACMVYDDVIWYVYGDVLIVIRLCFVYIFIVTAIYVWSGNFVISLSLHRLLARMELVPRKWPSAEISRWPRLGELCRNFSARGRRKVVNMNAQIKCWPGGTTPGWFTWNQSQVDGWRGILPWSSDVKRRREDQENERAWGKRKSVRNGTREVWTTDTKYQEI